MAVLTSGVIWEHERVVQYIQEHGYSRTTLQFPDDLLQHAPAVAQDLEQLLVQKGSGAKVRAIMPIPGRNMCVCVCVCVCS
jgi:diphthamide synthase subunit DPH2